MALLRGGTKSSVNPQIINFTDKRARVKNEIRNILDEGDINRMDVIKKVIFKFSDLTRFEAEQILEEVEEEN